MTRSLSIVGGVYRERCIHPQWNAVYGSAGRAAQCVTSLIGEPVRLLTYVADEIRDEVIYLANDCGAELIASHASHEICFDYLHPLSTPIISPSVQRIVQHSPIRVADDVVLRFGMLEGDAVIGAKIAVYDPQSAFGATHFSMNGSRAENLAVVMNRSEAFSMTGESDPDVAASKLIKDGSATVVIVKMGSQGAFVMTPTVKSMVPFYRTDRVWKIGSGDVFSATFSALWGCSGFDPIEAADLASRATAAYCETRTLPAPALEFLRSMSNSSSTQKTGTVYLAGPFFDLAQRWLIEEARDILFSLGASVFSPIHDVGSGAANVVASADIEGLEKSDVIFAIANGLDAGTIFEIGYAVKLKKPVVVLAQNIKEEDLKMIVGSGCEVVDDFTSALYRAVGRLPNL